MKVKYRMIRHSAVLVCLVLIAMLFPVTLASAAFSGQNGSNFDIDRDPAFSPDGPKIAFWSHRDGNEEIYVMAANGGNQQRLEAAKDPKSDHTPDWQPLRLRRR